MCADLTTVSHCAVPFLSRAPINLCWYYYTTFVYSKISLSITLKITILVLSSLNGEVMTYQETFVFDTIYEVRKEKKHKHTHQDLEQCCLSYSNIQLHRTYRLLIQLP